MVALVCALNLVALAVGVASIALNGAVPVELIGGWC